MSDTKLAVGTFIRKYSIMFTLVLAGCMQSPAVVNADRPDWLNSEPLEYPNARYLSATGSADSAERAKDRALANLSKVFELKIKESSTATSDVQSHKSGGNERVDTTQRLRRNIQIRTDKILDGARIAEQWYDGTEISHHALAVMDRRQAGNNIRSAISRLDAETTHELQRADHSNSSIKKVAQMNRAIGLQQERSTLQKTLKVIDLSGRGDPARWNLAELREKLETALLGMKMAVAIRQDDLGGLAAKVAGAMSHAGFPASSRDHEYIITSAVSLDPSFENQGWHWLRGNMSLTLTDATGRVMGNRSWPLKVSSVQKALLKPRMSDEVEKLLKAELKSAVLGFAQGDI